jgi:hypothetical protein
MPSGVGDESAESCASVAAFRAAITFKITPLSDFFQDRICACAIIDADRPLSLKGKDDSLLAARIWSWLKKANRLCGFPVWGRKGIP